jgi:hypothetical protein
MILKTERQPETNISVATGTTSPQGNAIESKQQAEQPTFTKDGRDTTCDKNPS